MMPDSRREINPVPPWEGTGEHIEARTPDERGGGGGGAGTGSELSSSSLATGPAEPDRSYPESWLRSNVQYGGSWHKPAWALGLFDLLSRVHVDSDFFVQAIGARVAGHRVERAERWGYPVGGFFSDLGAFAVEASRLFGASTYINPNPIRPEDRGDHRNRLVRLRSGEGAQSDDVGRIDWIVIDIDRTPEARQQGNATNDELAACGEVARRILTDEPTIEAASVRGVSGNGIYIAVFVDLPNTDRTAAMVRACLRALAARYNTSDAEIDQQWTATKMLPLPGSVKTKHPATPDRPHRIVSIAPLDRPIARFDLADWLERNDLAPRYSEPRFHVPNGSVLAVPARRVGASDRIGRAARWLARRAPAISGQGGRKHTFNTILVLLDGFDLTTCEALSILAGWNATCSPPWSDAELRGKVADAAKIAKGTGYLLSRSKGGAFGVLAFED